MNNKSRERVEHIIAVQTAWKEGKPIEQSLKGKDDWRDKYTPFDWAVYDYRVKEEDEPKEQTIEERANRMAGWILRRESMLKACNLPKLLTEMLEEQEAITKSRMIEKAYQWICESITIYVTCNEEDGYIIDYDEMYEDFRKEMEE